MPSESLSTANYTAVINDLREKRAEIDRRGAEIDRAIALLETMVCGEAADIGPLRAPLVQEDQSVPGDAPDDDKAASPLLAANIGLGEACLHVLRETKGSLSTREVTTTLEQSGYQFGTKNPVNNVWSSLNYRAKQARDVVRIGKLWRYAPRGEKDPRSDAEMNGVGQHL